MLLNLGKKMLPNLGVCVFVIHCVRGVRPLNPGMELLGLYSYEENCYSICIYNVLISSDIILHIIASMFAVPCETGPSDGGGSSGVERLVEDAFLQELDPNAYCVCVHQSLAAVAFLDVDRGCIEAMGL